MIVTLLLGVITFVFFNYQLDIRRFNKKKLELACYSAVQMNMAANNGSFPSVTYHVLIDSVDVQVTAELRGVLYFITAQAKGSKDSVKTVFTCARGSNDIYENALVLSKPDITPSVAGDTKIKGNILISGNTITRGNVYGIRNTIEQYQEGKLKKSTKIAVKAFQDTLLALLFRYDRYNPAVWHNSSLTLTAEELDTLRDINVTGDVIISGQAKAKNKMQICTIHANGRIIVAPGSIINKALLLSTDTTAELGRDCQIENMIITARKGVLVAPGCSMRAVQLFSGRDISLDRVKCLYPTILCSYADTAAAGSNNNQITLKESVLNGSVMLLCKLTGLSGNRCKIRIDEKSTVQGLVYSENYAEILGKIIGTVYTFNLWFYKEPTEYHNWLINTRIDRSELSEGFLLPCGFIDAGPLKVLSESWMY